jgi:hypothetical protein
MMPIQCATCKHAKPDLACKAFPDGIPAAILTGAFDHTEEYPGDGGIRYEPRPARRNE